MSLFLTSPIFCKVNGFYKKVLIYGMEPHLSTISKEITILDTEGTIPGFTTVFTSYSHLFVFI